MLPLSARCFSVGGMGAEEHLCIPLFSTEWLQTSNSLLVFDILASLFMLSADTWSQVIGLIALNSGGILDDLA